MKVIIFKSSHPIQPTANYRQLDAIGRLKNNDRTTESNNDLMLWCIFFLKRIEAENVHTELNFDSYA
jgi:hypothetical protein